MLVSVIIPCYNVEHYIGECIDSVLKQTHEPIEVICVDNNSTDGTMRIVNDYAVRYPDKIRVAAQTKQGGSAARNRGTEIAKGDWIQFLDADDLLLPEKLSRQTKIAEQATAQDSFIAGAYTKRSVEGTEVLMNSIEQNRFLAPFINNCGITSANLWKKDALTTVGGWNEELKSSQETDLIFRLILHGFSFPIDNVPNTIIRERETGQISQGDPSARLIRYVNVRLDYMDELEKKFPAKFGSISDRMYDFIVVSLLELSKHNAEKANEIFRLRVKKNWHSINAYGLSPLKSFLIKNFGLRFFSKLKG